MVKHTAVKPVTTQNCTKNHTVKNRSKFAAKNAACVNGTTEITLEQIQCNIVANLQCQKHRKFTLYVS